jgi:hypothetical protein
MSLRCDAQSLRTLKDMFKKLITLYEEYNLGGTELEQESVVIAYAVSSFLWLTGCGC